MKKLRFIVLTLAVILLFAGCATKFDSTSHGDGYTVSMLCDEDKVFDLEREDENSLAAWFFYMPDTAGEKTGDCYLLRSPEGKYMLVDSGYDVNAQAVIKNIEKLGIDKIDCCMLSHAHVDHIQGFPALIEKFDIDTIYMADITYNTTHVKNLQKVIENREMEVVYLHDGDTFNFTDDIEMQVFNPPKKITYPADGSRLTTASLNNYSLVVKTTYGKSSMLMTGDLYQVGETDLVKKYKTALKSDVLKVCHHGSESSSGITFINTVNPLVACIINNQMASTKVYATYKMKCESVMHTGLDGTCKVRFDGERNYECFTSKER